MNYFSTTFLVSLLLLWLGGNHLYGRFSEPVEPFPRQTLQRPSGRSLPRS